MAQECGDGSQRGRLERRTVRERARVDQQVFGERLQVSRRRERLLDRRAVRAGVARLAQRVRKLAVERRERRAQLVGSVGDELFIIGRGDVDFGDAGAKIGGDGELAVGVLGGGGDEE